MRSRTLILALAVGVVTGAGVAQVPIRHASAMPAVPAPGVPRASLEALVGHNVHIDLSDSPIITGGGMLIGLDGQVASVRDGWLTLVTDGKLHPEQPVVYVPLALVKLMWSAGATTRP
jgi:hypothetical protein